MIVINLHRLLFRCARDVCFEAWEARKDLMKWKSFLMLLDKA